MATILGSLPVPAMRLLTSSKQRIVAALPVCLVLLSRHAMPSPSVSFLLALPPVKSRRVFCPMRGCIAIVTLSANRLHPGRHQLPHALFVGPSEEQPILFSFSHVVCRFQFCSVICSSGSTSTRTIRLRYYHEAELTESSPMNLHHRSVRQGL